MPEGIDENLDGEQFKVDRDENDQLEQESQAVGSENADASSSSEEYPVVPDGMQLVEGKTFTAADGTEVVSRHIVPEGRDFSSLSDGNHNRVQDTVGDSAYHISSLSSSHEPTLHERLNSEEARAVASAMEADPDFHATSQKIGELEAVRERVQAEVDQHAADMSELNRRSLELDYRSKEAEDVRELRSEAYQKEQEARQKLPDSYEIKYLRQSINYKSEEAVRTTLEFFRLNPERFTAMPAAEFLEQAQKYAATKEGMTVAELRSKRVGYAVETIKGVIDEREQHTANELIQDVILRRATDEENRLGLTAEECEDILPKFGEITEGALDRTPMETYKLCLELAELIKSRYDERAAKLAKSLEELAGNASDDASKESAES